MTTVDLVDLANLRDELLASVGFGPDNDFYRRAETLTQSDLDDLRSGVLQQAKATLERLTELDASSDPPAVVRAESIPSAELVGRTLLWADHYLIPDRLAEALTLQDPDPSVIAKAVAAWHRERDLHLLGILVPTFDRLVVALTGDEVRRAAQRALDDRELMRWVQTQLVVHGPSAREVIFIEAKDDISRQPYMFLYGRIEPESVRETDEGGGRFGMAMLQGFDPDFDYGPWIDQERTNVGGRFVQDIVREAVVAEALGGVYVTNSLFRARLLHRMGAGSSVGATMWADVPSLPEADPQLLAKIASQQEPVAALRRTVARTLASVEHADADEQVRVVGDLVAELRDRAQHLEASIRSDRQWELVKAGLAGAAIAVGAAFGGPAGASAALGAAGILGSSAHREVQLRQRDAYVFWLADRSLKPEP